MAKSIGTMVVDLLLKDGQYHQGLKGAAGATKSTMPGIQKSITKVMGIATKSFVAAGAAMGAFGAASAVVGAGFEKQMSAVAAVRGITDPLSQDFTDLKDKAMELGSTTAFSATEAAQGMEALARAGLSTNQILGASEVALKLAGAGQVELGRSAEIIAASMSTFGIAAEDAATVADVFTVATQNSQFATEDLAQSMKFAGPVGVAFNKDITEVTAAVAQFRDLGLEGSMAGTQFRQMMASAAAPTKQAEAALAKYGLTVEDISPKTKSFGEIMQTLGDAGLEADDAMAIFTTRAGASVATLAQKFAEGRDSFAELQDKLENSAGATAKTYDVMTNNVAGKFADLRSKIEGVMLSLFETFREPLMNILGALSSFMAALSVELGTQGKDIGATFTELADIVVQFIEANTQTGVRAISDFIIMFQDLAVTITGLLPVIASLGTMFASLIPYLDELAILMSSVWVAVKVHGMVSAVVALIPALGGATTAVTAFGVAINVSTGGLVAIAAAITAVVVGLGVLIARTIRATNEQEKLAEASKRRADELATSEKVLAGQIGFKLAERQKSIRATLADADASAKLTEEQRRQMESILDLTDAQAAREFSQGNLIGMAGELLTVEEALTRGTEGQKRVLQDITVQQEKLAKLRKERQTAGPEAEQAIQKQIEVTQTRIRGLEKAMSDATQKQDENTEGVDRQAAALQDLIAGLGEGKQATEGMTGAQTELRDATQGTVQSLQDELMGLVSTSASIRQREFQQRRQDLDTLYAEQIELEKDNAGRVEQLRAEHHRALTTLGDIQRITERQAQTELASQIQDIVRSNGSEVEKLEREKQAAIADITDKGATDRQRMEVAAAYDRKIIGVRTDAEQRAQDLISQITGKGLKLRERLEREKQNTLDGLGEVSAETRAEVEEALDEDIAKSMRKNVIQSILDAGGAAVKFGSALVGAAKKGADAISGLLQTFTGFSFNIQDVIGGALDLESDAMDRQTDATERIAEAQAALAEARSEGDGGAIAEAEAELAEAQAALEQAETDLAGGMPEFARQFVQGMVDDAVKFVDALVAGIGPALETLGEQIGPLLDKVIAAIPKVVQAFVDNIPTIIQGVISRLPELITALVSAATTLILTVVNMLPSILTELLTVVLPTLISEVAAALPVIIQGLIDALPDIITAIVEAIPVVIGSIVDALPDIITALVGLLPELIAVIIMAIPEIAVALVMGVITELIPAIPGIIATLFKELIRGMGAALKAVAEGIWNAIKGFFNIFKKKDGKGKKGKKGAFSGIGYVPATMRMTLHKGEAVIPADRNASSAPGDMAPAPAGFSQNFGGQGGMGQSPPIDIAVMAEGRLLDAVQVVAAKRGHATGVVKEIRRASGVKVGLSRGRFSAFSTK